MNTTARAGRLRVNVFRFPSAYRRVLPLVVFLAGVLPGEGARPIVRVPGAVYLYDLGQPPKELAVTRSGVRAFSDARLSRYAGTLRFPQSVRVSAFLADAALISGLARQGRISAWVRVRDLDGLPAGFFEDLRAAEERREAVEALIARNEVALGMTEEEVGRSLGRPQRTSRSADRDATRTVWEFVRYRNVPQTVFGPQTGRTVRWAPGRGPITSGGTFVQPVTQWVRVPVGKTIVTFENGVVTGVAEREDNQPSSRPRIVAPPVRMRF